MTETTIERMALAYRGSHAFINYEDKQAAVARMRRVVETMMEPSVPVMDKAAAVRLSGDLHAAQTLRHLMLRALLDEKP